MHAAEVAAGRGGRRRAADEHHAGQRGRDVGVADAGQRLGDRRVRGAARPARGSSGRRRCPTEYCSSRRTGADSSGSISSSSRSGSAAGSSPQQVGRVVGVHRLQHVRGPVARRGAPAARAGRPRTAPRRRRPAARRPARRRPRGGASPAARAACAATSAGRSVSSTASSPAGALPVGEREPGDRAPRPRSATCAAPGQPAAALPHGEPARPPSRGCGWAPSRRRRRPRRRPVSAIRTGASSSWPTTSTSLGRCSNRRRLTEPVASVTAPGSMRGDPQHRHEDPPPRRHLDDQAEHPRRVARRPAGPPRRRAPCRSARRRARRRRARPAARRKRDPLPRRRA